MVTSFFHIFVIVLLVECEKSGRPHFAVKFITFSPKNSISVCTLDKPVYIVAEEDPVFSIYLNLLDGTTAVSHALVCVTNAKAHLTLNDAGWGIKVPTIYGQGLYSFNFHQIFSNYFLVKAL